MSRMQSKSAAGAALPDAKIFFKGDDFRGLGRNVRKELQITNIVRITKAKRKRVSIDWFW